MRKMKWVRKVEVNMNVKIISVFVILILALSTGLPAASATPAAKKAYQEVYPTAPDPAPDENSGNCGGLCHNPTQPALSDYGKKLNNTAVQIYGQRFKQLSDPQKIDVLKKVGSGFSIFGMKFHDRNGNGKRDSGEEGLAGWHIRLIGIDTLTMTPVNREEITDANGSYGLMDVGTGIYQVFEMMQGPNWVPTTPVTVPINLKAGESINVDFGNRKIP